MRVRRTLNIEFKPASSGTSPRVTNCVVRGAFFLHELDERMERTGLFYVRFMDDITGEIGSLFVEP